MNRVGSLVNYMKKASEHLVTEAEWMHTNSEANKTAMMKFSRECIQEELRPIQEAVAKTNKEIRALREKTLYHRFVSLFMVYPRPERPKGRR